MPVSVYIAGVPISAYCFNSCCKPPIVLLKRLWSKGVATLKMCLSPIWMSNEITDFSEPFASTRCVFRAEDINGGKLAASNVRHLFSSEYSVMISTAVANAVVVSLAETGAVDAGLNSGYLLALTMCDFRTVSVHSAISPN